MIKIFETFAGVGAQHKAIQILNENQKGEFKIIATSEWDVWANISYDEIHNFNLKEQKVSKEEMLEFLRNFDHSFNSKKPTNFKSIEKLDEKIIQKLYFSFKNSNNLGSILNISGDKLLPDINDEIDLITYSFPCQDLSVAGNLHGFNQGMKKGDGTRSGLLWEIERILEELKLKKKLPKYLLLENVKNMLSPKHLPDYEIWLGKLDELGYNTQTYVLNALEYGIPQARERVFALSVLKTFNPDFSDTFKTTQKIIEGRTSEIPKDISQELKIKRRLDELLRVEYQYQKYRKEAEESTPNWTPSREIMLSKNPWLNFLGPLDKNSIEKNYDRNFEGKWTRKWVRTITTKQDRNPNAGLVLLNGTSLAIPKPKMNKTKANFRFLTPRETFLLMGFEEEDFNRIKENEFLRQDVLYRQAGNSIVVNVLVAIFNKISEMEKKND